LTNSSPRGVSSRTEVPAVRPVGIGVTPMIGPKRQVIALRTLSGRRAQVSTRALYAGPMACVRHLLLSTHP